MVHSPPAPPEDKRLKIILAAEELFSRNGFSNTQIAEIAQKAGVGIGTFYRHFQDKEALLLAMLESLFIQVKDELAAIRSGIERWSPLEQIVTVRKTYEVAFRVLLSRPQISLVFLRSGYGTSDKVSAHVWDWLNRIIADVAMDLERAENEGLIRMPDKITFGHAIMGMLLQIAHKIIIEGRPDEAQAADLCTRLTMNMLASYIPEDLFEKLIPVYRMLLVPMKGRSGDATE